MIMIIDGNQIKKTDLYTHIYRDIFTQMYQYAAMCLKKTCLRLARSNDGPSDHHKNRLAEL